MNPSLQQNGLILATACFLALSLVDSAWATPSFSRQINADCRTCHFQSMPALNKFGREFKRNAFSLSKEMREELAQQRKNKAATTEDK